ncbi:GNAT family acetyltransferase [Paenibacillus sp. FSL H7-0357]|uniref:GNAT family N-acetyltransferase n=1 Tax=Paenibacillus sp. FSL H7-0357 TaxID=1536774 RepID=UPI0004F69113|nr:GNAT family N-acetyltransferase [Paenibacillus sp. FSL H7-0357]AIQ17922.1 GNAT family acetyltransferase [Paenibacillus sp. FSL H7-0357]
MNIDQKGFEVKGLSYIIRSADPTDAANLSILRLQIDGETENMDRVQGEGVIDTSGFEQLIARDTEDERNLFLVAEAEGKIVAFSRCEGNHLTRFSHKVEFGICAAREYWGFGIGKHLLEQSLAWADANGITKIILYVLETNEKAVQLYKKFGFEIEGVITKDRILSDGNYYNTIVMGRFKL